MRTALILVLGCAATSCSPANVGSPADAGRDAREAAEVGPSDASLSPEVGSACREYAGAICARLMACSSTVFQIHFGTNAETCTGIYTSLCENTFNVPGTGETVATRSACTAALQDWSCDDIEEVVDLPAACAVTGSLPDDAGCAVMEQCRSGYCGYANGAACGKCGPPPLEGAPCTTTQCALGFECVGGVCRGYGLENDPCGEGQPNCLFGLNCDEAMTPAVCEPPTGKAAGAPCSIGAADCNFGAGLGCNGETGKCEATALRDPGSACGVVAGVQTECLSGVCVQGICVRNLYAGDPCDLGGPAICAGATSCVTADGETHGRCEVRGSEPCP